MKKISKISLMLGVTLLTMNANAGTVDLAMDVKKDHGKTVTFVSDKMKKGDLSIYDNDGKFVYSEKVDLNNNASKKYDLKYLAEGTYFLEAESDSKISTYKISVDREKALLSANAISEVYKPVFVNNKGLVSVSLQNQDKSPVRIKIYDKEDNEVYASESIIDENVKKVFDINRIKNQEYTFVMAYKDKTFMKTYSNN